MTAKWFNRLMILGIVISIVVIAFFGSISNTIGTQIGLFLLFASGTSFLISRNYLK